jgi:hypothetical protein
MIYPTDPFSPTNIVKLFPKTAEPLKIISNKRFKTNYFLLGTNNNRLTEH